MPPLVECPTVNSPTAPSRIISSSSRARRNINVDLRPLIHLPDPDEPQVGLRGDRSHPGDRIYLEHLVALALGRHQKRQRHRIVARLGAVRETADGVEEAGRTVAEMFPTSDTIWWFGQSIGDTRSTAARTALPVPSATIAGFSLRNVVSRMLAASSAIPAAGERRSGIGRHELHNR